MLDGGKSVTLLCGAGCSGAHDEVVALAKHLKAPIVHALRGKEVVEYDNPYDVGMTGLIGFSSGYRAMEHCDALVMLGTDFPYRPFYPEGVPVIQVDVRGERIGRRVRVEVPLVGTVRDTVAALAPRLTAKTDSRLAAYADVDEANSAIGMAVTFGELPADIAALLTRVQNEMFDVGADLATPVSPEPPPYPPLRIDPAYIERLESECDAYNADLPTLRSFLLPGGSPGAALLHVARTVTRRAERSAWAAADEHGDSVSPLPARYLNRLSDLLFILSRVANAGHGDVLWKPGGDRGTD
jgi:cob(I)alamin adenosyltransferase